MRGLIDSSGGSPSEHSSFVSKSRKELIWKSLSILIRDPYMMGGQMGMGGMGMGGMGMVSR